MRSILDMRVDIAFVYNINRYAACGVYDRNLMDDNDDRRVSGGYIILAYHRYIYTSGDDSLYERRNIKSNHESVASRTIGLASRLENLIKTRAAQFQFFSLHLSLSFSASLSTARRLCIYNKLVVDDCAQPL